MSDEILAHNIIQKNAMKERKQLRSLQRGMGRAKVVSPMVSHVLLKASCDADSVEPGDFEIEH